MKTQHTQKLSLGIERNKIYNGVVPVIQINFDPTNEFRDKVLKAVNLHDELLTELIRCRAAVKNAVESLKHLGCKSESTDYYLNEAAKSDDLLKRAKGEV